MIKVDSNYYGRILIVIMVITLVGLRIGPSPTGFAVKLDKCIEGTALGECSVVNPKYCDKGALKDNCHKCGCREGEVCQVDGSCLPKCSDGTVYSFCSDNKPLLCHTGLLLENCFECGCFPGQTCMNDGTCSGGVQTGAGAEEKIKIEETIQEPIQEEPVIEEPEVKEVQNPGFWWNLFCKVFYFNEYDECISDAVRNQNK